MMGEPELVVTIDVVGGAAADAVQYGKVQIKTAKDDKGKALRMLKSEFSIRNDVEGFVKVDRDMMFMNEPNPEKTKDKIRLDLRFKPSDRAATKMSLIEGSLKLRTAKQKEILVPAVKKMVGKAVEDPALKEAGVTVSVMKPGENTGGADATDSTVTVHIAGKRDMMTEIGLVDAAGERLHASTSSSSDGTEETLSFTAMEKFPDDAKLKILVATGMQEVDVPFKLENIPMP